MEKAVTLVGQAINSTNYYRRRNVLMNIWNNDKKKVKDILSDNKELSQEKSLDS